MVTGDYIRSAVDYLEVNRGAGFCITRTLLVSSWTRLSFEDGESLHSQGV